ncbi:DUF5721 family protein [Butyrivibrio sp. MC2021]|uniref:DUF5721 family protein n=1 Tax=Butyrivibrio sp. MC2021 TaxID=1408306 RepID=UPI0004799E7B|nr:DUF5721 family protein [Butyrivibrio sp. MC2021]
MTSVKITNKKNFMAKLLAGELFDEFLVEEAEITTFNTFHIDGQIRKEFYRDTQADNAEEKACADYSSWKDLKQICYDLIKGKRTPLSFKFVFYLNDEAKSKLIKEADAGINEEQIKLALNIRFINGDIILTTGCAISIFTLDKSIEKAWDSYIPSFLDQNSIENEIL